jgi:NAD(P)-dependent dehydrogenase (short-subunit alcohol dehydrogenase family)
VLDLNPSEHDKITYYECDISDKHKVKSVAEYIIRDYGHPTIIINNAGIVKGKTFMELTETEFEK